MTSRAAALALALCGLVAGCSDPRAHVHADPSGALTPSASSGVGPVRVGVTGSGHGYVGTQLGWLGLSAGF